MAAGRSRCPSANRAAPTSIIEECARLAYALVHELAPSLRPVANRFFTGSPFIVELEKDLSIKKQLLDVVILRRGSGNFAEPLPDGLEELAPHNLLTFKSHREALDDWALKELTGHYVNYRKQVSPADRPLLPESEFRLYAVCSRYPHNLASAVALDRCGPASTTAAAAAT